MTGTSVKQTQGDYLGLISAPLVFSSATTYVIPIPGAAYVQATFTATGQKLFLPEADLSNSLRVGQCIEIQNSGLNNFDIYLANNSELYAGLEPTCKIRIYYMGPSDDEAGLWEYDEILNGERIDSYLLTTDYEVSTDDCGKTFIFNEGVTVSFITIADYQPGFYINLKTEEGKIGTITAHSGDTIDGQGSITIQNFGAVTIFKADSQWLIKSSVPGGFMDLLASTVTLETGGSIRTNTLAGNTALIQAYDVNDTVYRTFGTLTANNTPSFAIAAPSGGTLTFDGGVIGGVTPAAGNFTTVGATGNITSGVGTGTGYFVITTPDGYTQSIEPASAPGVNTTFTMPSTSGTLALTSGVVSGTTVVTGTSQSMVVNHAYYSNNAGLVTMTLPSTAAVGDLIEVGGLGAGGWRIAQNSGQLIHLGSSVTTTGATGHIDSTNQYDCVVLRCIVANTTWNTVSVVGDISYT